MKQLNTPNKNKTFVVLISLLATSSMISITKISTLSTLESKITFSSYFFSLLPMESFSSSVISLILCLPLILLVLLTYKPGRGSVNLWWPINKIYMEENYSYKGLSKRYSFWSLDLFCLIWGISWDTHKNSNTQAMRIFYFRLKILETWLWSDVKWWSVLGSSIWFLRTISKPSTAISGQKIKHLFGAFLHLPLLWQPF